MKKILLRSYTEGNMECLYKYYDLYLRDKYNEDYKVILNNHYKYKNNRFKGFLFKLSEYFYKYHVVVADCTTSRLYKRGKYSIYMSHGYGTKSTPGLDELSNKNIMNMYKHMREKLDYIITLSKRDNDYFLKSKWLNKFKEPKYIPLGLPRNDELFSKSHVDDKNEMFKKNYCKDNKRVILYCPTWRNYKIDSNLFSTDKLNKLDKFLNEKNCILFYRSHYINSIIDLKTIKSLKNIKLIDFEMEPYTQNILCATDILITDYSSIYIDYLILDRPIIFFNFDEDKYKKNRGLEINFNSNIDTPGDKVKSIDEMINSINNIIDNNDIYAEDRAKSMNNFYRYKDSNAAKRVWSLIFSLE